MNEENTNTETQAPAAPELTPEQVAMQQKLTQISVEVGQAYLQDAARLLANVAGALGSPLSFAYDTQNGGKALVFALSADVQTVAQVVRVIEAVITPVPMPAPAEASAPSDAVSGDSPTLGGDHGDAPAFDGVENLSE